MSILNFLYLDTAVIRLPPLKNMYFVCFWKAPGYYLTNQTRKWACIHNKTQRCHDRGDRAWLAGGLLFPVWWGQEVSAGQRLSLCALYHVFLSPRSAKVWQFGSNKRKKGRHSYNSVTKNREMPCLGSSLAQRLRFMGVAVFFKRKEMGISTSWGSCSWSVG